MKKLLKIYFLIFIFLIFSTYNIKQNKNKESYSFLFPIKEIFIENAQSTNLFELESDLSFLINKSLILLSKEKILSTMNKHDFISSVQLKKKYPNTLKIIIFEKTPIATHIINKKKFYITKDNKKINFKNIKKYENLPSIFGNYKTFDIFYSNLEKNNFKTSKIKAYYFFDVGRWDILLKNGKIIKFPEKNYLDILPKINLMLEDNSFTKYKIFDFRINNQLILE